MNKNLFLVPKLFFNRYFIKSLHIYMWHEKVKLSPMTDWDSIAPEQRHLFVMKICLFGSESTGKTSLAKLLAEHYETDWVPEMAREILGDRKCEAKDFPDIAHAQIEAVNHKLLTANKLLFCDTDLITTLLYEKIYFGTENEEVRSLQVSEYYNLYLFLETDIPWIEDSQRDLGGNRRLEIRNLFEQALIDRKINYVIIKGDFETRLKRAIAAIDEFVKA
jgi:HTH-type transcriptional regulator, transcriptional repressor of NAD biosynthesis genes